MDRETLKKLAGEKATEYVKNGMVLGLGTGSTVEHTIRKIGELVKDGLKITGIPTSSHTKKLAKEYNIPTSNLEEHSSVDLTIDGADEVDQDFNLIKGGGGALTREKIVAYHSKKEIIVIDESKIVKRMGSLVPLPVEVVKFGWLPVKRNIEELGCTVELRKITDEPYITDNSNYILDCEFEKIEDPEKLEKDINNIPGVVENGLFIDLANIIIVGCGQGVRILEK